MSWRSARVVGALVTLCSVGVGLSGAAVDAAGAQPAIPNATPIHSSASATHVGSVDGPAPFGPSPVHWAGGQHPHFSGHAAGTQVEESIARPIGLAGSPVARPSRASKATGPSRRVVPSNSCGVFRGSGSASTVCSTVTSSRPGRARTRRVPARPRISPGMSSFQAPPWRSMPQWYTGTPCVPRFPKGPPGPGRFRSKTRRRIGSTPIRSPTRSRRKQRSGSKKPQLSMGHSRRWQTSGRAPFRPSVSAVRMRLRSA